MATYQELEAVTKQLGFGTFKDVLTRKSVADVFPKGQRCGLYILSFADGEAYVGRTVDVVQRFAQHRATYKDMRGLAFRPLTVALQGIEEPAAVTLLERASIPLRNIQFASVVLGETDLDLVVPPALQIEWLADRRVPAGGTNRIVDLNLRRKYRARFEQLCTFRQWPTLRVILQAYARTCIPFAVETELTFWSITCLPGRSLVRVNINAQEVLVAWVQEGTLGCAFQLRESMLGRTDSGWAEGVEFASVRYAPGGDDQLRVTAWEDAPGNILKIINSQAFRKAAQHFNLSLMRKGANLNARSHCFDLADVLLAP